MSFIQNIQSTAVFFVLEGALSGFEKIAHFTPNPWDNIAIATFRAILEALKQANSKDEALQAVASALPDDELPETA